MVNSHSCLILVLVFFVLLLTVGCATPRAYIGVELDEFNLVKKVVPDNPAQQAGIRSGDIVLGIKKDKVSDSKNQTPGIGNVPVIGNLFKGKAKSDSLNELLVFIAPRIL